MYVYLFDELGVLYGPAEIDDVPGLGRLMPANGIEVEEELVKADEGKVWALVNEVPTQLADHRGTVYEVATGLSGEWTKLGELPAEYTLLPYPGQHYIWGGAEWVLDEVAAAKAQRNQLLDAANQATAGMADAYIAGLLDKPTTTLYKAFAAYKVALSKIEEQPGFPTTIDWPTSP
jgi:hypothetical protein